MSITFILLLACFVFTSDLASMPFTGPLPHPCISDTCDKRIDNNIVIIAQINPLKLSFDYLCSGVRINNKTILTAAHAVRDIDLSTLCIISSENGKIPTNIMSCSDFSFVKRIASKPITATNTTAYDISTLTPDKQDLNTCEYLELDNKTTNDTYQCSAWSTNTDELNAVSYTLIKHTNNPIIINNKSYSTNISETIIQTETRKQNTFFPFGNSGSPVYTEQPGRLTRRLAGIISFVTYKDGASIICIETIDNLADLTEIRENTNLNCTEGDIINDGLITFLPRNNSVVTFSFSDKNLSDKNNQLLIRHFVIKPERDSSIVCATIYKQSDHTPIIPYVTVQEFPRSRCILREYLNEQTSFCLSPDQYTLVTIEIPLSLASQKPVFTIEISRRKTQ